MSFLIPLANTFLVTIGLITAFLIVAISPWPLQLMLLIAGLLTAQWALRSSDLAEIESQLIHPEEEEVFMDLADPDPPSAVASEREPHDVRLTYRGSSYSSHLSALPSFGSFSQARLALKYRGISVLDPQNLDNHPKDSE